MESVSQIMQELYGEDLLGLSISSEKNSISIPMIEDDQEEVYKEFFETADQFIGGTFFEIRENFSEWVQEFVQENELEVNEN